MGDLLRSIVYARLGTLAAALLLASAPSSARAAAPAPEASPSAGPAEREAVFPRALRAALRLHVRDEVQLTGSGTDRKAPREFTREFVKALRAAFVEQGFTVVTSAGPGVVSVSLSAQITTGWAPFIWSYEEVKETLATFERDGVVLTAIRGPWSNLTHVSTYNAGSAQLAAAAAASAPLAAAAAQPGSPHDTVAVAATAGPAAPAAVERWRAVARRESRLAVLEFRGALPREILGALADEARGAALDATADVGCTVMTRESLATILRDMGRSGSCGDGECEVDVARSIGADLVVSGEVMTVEGTHVLTMKLHESAKGALLATSRAKASTSLSLLDATRPAAAALFRAP